MNIPYEKEQLTQWCKESFSYNQVLVKAGKTKSGTTRATLKKYIELYNIDISHFTHSTSPVSYYNIDYKIQRKVCQQCNQEKDIYQDFYWSKGHITRSICKECVRLNERLKYQNRMEGINNYKKTLICKKCGESRFYLLDFHHRNPEEKLFSISATTHKTLEQLKSEIEKCDVLCSNCHREWHYLSEHKQIDYQTWLTED